MMNYSIALLASIMLITSSIYEYPMPIQYNGIIELSIARIQFEGLNPSPQPDPNPDPNPSICSTCDNTGYIYIEADGRRRKVQCNNDDCPYWANRIVPPEPEPKPEPVITVIPDPAPKIIITIDAKDFNYVFINGVRTKRSPPPLYNRNYVSAKWVSYDVWQECYGDRCQRFRIKTDDKKINLGLNLEQYNISN